KAAGIVVMPGTGFDVVPSDCLALTLKEALPEATNLELAFHGSGSSSRGTTMTMVEALPMGGAVRRDGRIRKVPTASITRTVPFFDKPRYAVAIPWGDVSTAYQSTKIPNITVYLAMKKSQVRGLKVVRYAGPLLGTGLVQRWLKGWVDKKVKGPSDEVRAKARTELWGRVEAEDGSFREATLRTPEGYTLTARTAVECIERILRGEVEPGFKTPGQAFGAGFITTIEGCELRAG
ncbi:MAG: saccharopine dehydrogenase family protein, partial [Planctomycetota bacterium]